MIQRSGNKEKAPVNVIYTLISFYIRGTQNYKLLFNSLILTLCGVLFAPLIFCQTITVNGSSLNQTSGTCDANTYQLVGTSSANGSCIDMNGTGNFQQGAVWVCNTIRLYQSFKLNFKANFLADQLT